MQKMNHLFGDGGQPEGARFQLGAIYLVDRAVRRLSDAKLAEIVTLHASMEPVDGKIIMSTHKVPRLGVVVMTSKDRSITVAFALSPGDL